MPHEPLDLVRDVETYDIKCGHHRHGPQEGYEDQECEIHTIRVSRWWDRVRKGSAFWRSVELEVGGTVGGQEDDDCVVDYCERRCEEHKVE